MSCAICPADSPQLADLGHRTCTPCVDRLRTDLRDIPGLYARVTPFPATGASTGRGAPGFGSRPPCNLTAAVLTDARSNRTAVTWRGSNGRLHHEPTNPTLSVARELARVTVHIRTHRGITSPHPADVESMVAFIDANLDWLSRHDEITHLARITRQLLRQLRPATGDLGRIRIGRCPNFDPNAEPGPDGQVPDCGAILHAPVSGDVVECRRCHRRWNRPDWIRLGQTMAAA